MKTKTITKGQGIALSLLFLLTLFCLFFTKPVQASSHNVSSKKEAIQTLRKDMINREDTINITFTSSKNDYVAGEVFDRAFRITKDGRAGDYLDRSFSYAQLKQTTKALNNKKYQITLTYELDFYTTKAQEEETTRQINKVLKQLNLKGKSEYAKAKAINDWIKKNITYDHEHEKPEQVTYNHDNTAYGALMHKKCTCEGFASLYYRLAVESGLKARIVIGTFDGALHAWNIVKVNKKYYYVDCAPDLNNYFLKGTNSKEYKTHIPDSEHRSIHVSSISYNKMDLRCSAKVKMVKNCRYTGKAKKPSVIIRSHGKLLKKGRDYTLSYKNNIKAGKATVTIKGKGKYKGTIKRTFNIIKK